MKMSNQPSPSLHPALPCLTVHHSTAHCYRAIVWDRKKAQPVCNKLK